MSRPVTRQYQDPLDSLWLECARRVGLEVERAPDAYASTDGRGKLVLSDAAGLDADDSLAQMILHELCHSLIQGAHSFQWIDWGLDNEGNRDDVLEQACLRLQAALLEPLGLRQVLAPTTDFRAFYDALPADPFEEREPSERESIVRARAAFARRVERPWGPHLGDALRATSTVVAAAREFATDNTLLGAARPPTALHRSGFALHPAPSADKNCGSCAWAFQSKSEQLRCRIAQTKSIAQTKIGANEPACERFEAELACLSCGACCREAYDVVVVKKSDPAARLHREMLVPTSSGFDLVRADGRCVALSGGTELEPHVPAITRLDAPTEFNRPRSLPRFVPDDTPFTCSIYETRPQTCRDFTRGSQNCLDARRKVGLSR